MFSFIHSIIGNNNTSVHTFRDHWPFVAKKFTSNIYFSVIHPTNNFASMLTRRLFKSLQPMFSFILATQDQLDVYHSLSLASKAQQSSQGAAEGK
jgi:hypothetical protein